MKDWKIIYRARFRLEADQWKQSLALARMNPLRFRALYKRFPSSWIEILSLNISVSDGQYNVAADRDND